MQRSSQVKPWVSATVLGTAVLLVATVASATGLGVRDFSYAGTTAPTGEKPESKLWFNAGHWWGAMFNTSTKRFEIYRLDWATQQWSGTGVQIDDRANMRQDALWDGTHLYVLSGAMLTSNTDARLASGAGRIYSFSYQNGTYVPDPGFPVTAISDGGAEAMVLAEEASTGRLWVTYTANQKVMVAHSTTDPKTWGAPFGIPTTNAANLTSDDISSIVAFNGQIGVMWGNQTLGIEAYYFAVHANGADDGSWVTQKVMGGAGSELADDHINLKALEGDPSGQVFAALKTSLNGSGDPLIQLLRRKADGSWTRHTFGTVAFQHTRPIVLLDRQHRQLYMFASAPCCSGGTIYYKQVALDALTDTFNFPAGLGAPFIALSSDTKTNNVTSTKQSLDSTTGLVVEAGDDSTRYYAHNWLDLGVPPPTAPPDTAITNGPSATTTATTATFAFSATQNPAAYECKLDSAHYSPCTSPSTYAGLAQGSHTFAVRGVNSLGPDPTPATAGWTVIPNLTPFSDSFESGGFSGWTSVNKGGDGTATVIGSDFTDGTHSARLSATTNAGSYADIRKVFATNQTEVTITGDVKIVTEGASGKTVPVFRIFDPSGVRVIDLARKNGTGALTLTVGGTTYATGQTVQLGTWNHFRLHVIASGTGVSTAELSLNGTVIFSTTTGSLALAGIRTLQFGSETKRQAFTLLADNIGVN
jgi:hypothetical protein